MRSQTHTLSAAIACLSALALAACSSAAPSSSPGAADTTGSSGASAGSITLYPGMSTAPDSATVDTTKYKKDKSSYTIGYASLNLVNSFQVQREKSAELIAAQYGAKLVTTNANNDANTQVSNVEDLLAQSVDALVISPASLDSLKPVLRRAAQANVPVIVEGSNVNSTDVTSRVFATNATFGKAGGEGLCTIMKGQGKVVMLRGVAGVQAEKDRYDAAKAAMQKCGLQVEGEAYGSWTYAGGQQAAETLVAQYPQIDGIWSSGSEMTRAAIDVFKAHGRALVPMTGECENGYLQIWQQDKLQSVAPIFPTWQTPESVKLALMALHGTPIKSQYELQLPPITDDNVGQFVNASESKDWWSDGVLVDGKLQNYLTDAQIKQIFP